MIKGLIIPEEQPVFEENMSNLTSAISGDQTSVSSASNIRSENGTAIYPQHYFAPPPNQQTQPPVKKKRNLPGNPDPDAEVVALSPKTLMATNRFVCDICNKGFQRDQNLQLHRRGHNLPWKLKQRSSKNIVRKKVYVCPEPSCVHHDPSRALGDLTGIKKHFCRKHGEKKWKCDKCTKRYAVQSDWKAHSKTCGTREYRCDCGTLFSRRDSFITHRAFCDALAEESARSVTGINPLLSSSQSAGISTPHMNLQVQSQFNTHDLHAFSMKKEQQNFSVRPAENIPPWLASPPGLGPPPIDLTSSSIFSTRLDNQDFTQNQDLTFHENPNPSLGPTLPPYHQTGSPHMSATALLQKAAQMGATMSSKTNSSPALILRPHQVHVSANSANSTTGFGLNLSSREELTSGFVHSLASFGNKAAFPSGLPGHVSPATALGTGAPPPPSFLQDMMSSLSSSTTGFEGSTFEDAFTGFLNSKKDHGDFYESTLSKTTTHHEAGGGEIGNDGMTTRDFLGLRPLPLSHSDILSSIAGLGNRCMNSNSDDHDHDHQKNQNQKTW